MLQDIKLLSEDERLPVADAYIGVRQFEVIEYVSLCREVPVRITRVNRAFIGTLDQIQCCVNALTEDDFAWAPMFFIAGENSGVKAFMDSLEGKKCNVLYIPMDILDALNRINEILGDFRWWQSLFDGFSQRSVKLQEIIDSTAKMLDCPVFLLNMGYSLVACQGAEQAAFLGCDELIHKGFLPIHAVGTLRENKDVLFFPIHQGVSTIAWLLICPGEKKHVSEVYITLSLDALKNHLRRPVGSSQNRRIEFEQLVYDFIEMNIQSGDEVRQRIELLDLKFRPFYCCMVITGKEKKQGINLYIPQLKRFFSEAQFAIYSRSIVVLIRLDQRSPEYLYSREFVEFLEEKELKAGVSSGGRSIEYFRTFYIMALQALKFGGMLGHEDPADKSPLYYFEDYRMYHMVDLCREGFVRMYSHEHTVFLCHPVIVTLAEYDRENQTNLLQVLYTYLRCSCNLAQTARRLNFHRNTIMNKVAKIEEITDISLNDPRWPPVLLFSCMVYFIMNKEW